MKKYTAIYTGRRLWGKKTIHRFETPEGKELNFSKISRIYIGYTYELSNKSQIARRPSRTDAERIDNPDWEAQDALVDAERKKSKAEARFKKASSPHLKVAVEALLPLLKNTDFFGQKALIEFLVSEARQKLRGKKS